MVVIFVAGGNAMKATSVVHGIIGGVEFLYRFHFHIQMHVQALLFYPALLVLALNILTLRHCQFFCLIHRSNWSWNGQYRMKNNKTCFVLKCLHRSSSTQLRVGGRNPIVMQKYNSFNCTSRLQ
ncbi:uncharacterized protein LOC102800536 [Saccoglossus kowalevskii]|uniref:Uncharacterized protein LOC102800536 n=1 Tax=Saccoglossus kowalevskii TaxID=10224 RepID=A0ABM0M3Q2_SACKO|nr:PREDICTED: uncharacterized protein LOC102800536 [Saccoglossus kowalevskii]